MNTKLPVMAIFLEALTFPYKYFKPLLKLSLPMLLLGSILIDQLFLPLLFEGEGNLLLIGGVLLVTTLILVTIIVGCHRIFILKEQAIEQLNWFNWSGNELRFIGRGILLTLCMGAMAIPYIVFITVALSDFSNVASFTYILMFLVIIPLYYMWSRWLLVFPAAAVGERGKGLGWSWNISIGNGWRLTLLLMFLPVVFQMLTTVALEVFMPIFNPFVLTVMTAVLTLLVGAVNIAILSLSYQYLVDNQVEQSNDENSPVMTQLTSSSPTE